MYFYTFRPLRGTRLFPDEWTGYNVMDRPFRFASICLDSFTVSKSYDDLGKQDLHLQTSVIVTTVADGQTIVNSCLFTLADHRVAKFEESETMYRDAQITGAHGFADYDITHDRYAGCQFGVPVPDNGSITVSASGLEYDSGDMPDISFIGGAGKAASALRIPGVPDVLGYANSAIGIIPTILGWFGVTDENDPIGTINEHYFYSDNFGDGAHEVLSEDTCDDCNGDITLRYYISAPELDLSCTSAR